MSFFFESKHKYFRLYSSSQNTIKLKLIASISEFNPLDMLLTNELTPVAIDNFLPTVQNLWFFNPYSSDIRIKLISFDNSLSFVTDDILIKSQEHSSAFVSFRPNYVGHYDVSNVIIARPHLTPSQLPKKINY